jgi:4-amino-4-deoxy-L-arabinose transferase-like glycosyltransferase
MGAELSNYPAKRLRLQPQDRSRPQSRECSPPYGRNIGYPVVLALTYLIHPDPISGRILNAVFSALSIYLVYGIGRLAGGPLPGLLSALFMTLAVSDIMMTSVLCTDVGNLTLMLASLYFFFRALREPT